MPELDGQGKTVLLIDDEPSVLELLNDITSELHFTVLEASDPITGIGVYRKEWRSVSFVILDYSMPGLDGKAAFEELLKINNRVKVLLCSGYTEEEMRDVFGDVHPVAFIQKPYKPEKLLAKISSLFAKGVSPRR